MDRTAGDRAWIVDFIAPAQLAEEVIGQLAKGPLAGKSFKLRTVDENGNGVVRTVSGEDQKDSGAVQ